MMYKHVKLQGRVAVITGGSGVLGAEMAKELGRQGMKVVILNVNPSKGQKVVDAIKEEGGEVIFSFSLVFMKKKLKLFI